MCQPKPSEARMVSLTCFSTLPPMLLLKSAKAVTFGTMSSSQASTEGGTSAAADGALAPRDAVAASPAAPPAAAAAEPLPACHGCVARSSRREVAASSLMTSAREKKISDALRAAYDESIYAPLEKRREICRARRARHLCFVPSVGGRQRRNHQRSDASIS